MSELQELLKRYEFLLESAEQLHKDVPKIKSMYEKVRSEFVNVSKQAEDIGKQNDELASNAKKQFSDMEKRIEKLCDEKITLLEKIEKSAAITTAQLQKMVDKIPNLQAQYTDLENKIQKAEQKMDTLTKDVSKAMLLPNHQREELKDGELFSGLELTQKLSDRFGVDLFVRRINPDTGKSVWYNDYCLFVKESNDSQIIGDIYLDGKIREKNKPHSINDKYAIYRGPNELAILESIQYK